MSSPIVIHTDQAPAALGTYSQAIRVDSLVFLSGSLGMDPQTLELVEGGIEAQAEQAFRNMEAVARAAGGSLADMVKMTVFLQDIKDFQAFNQVMARCCKPPYPARSAFQVAALPKNAAVEIEAVLAL